MKRISPSAWDRIVFPRWSCTFCSTTRPIEPCIRPLARSNTSIQTRSFSSTIPRPVSSTLNPKKSAKLAALHARLSLSKTFPVTTLARTLIDPSAESNPALNNDPLCVIGNTLNGYIITEYLMCNYPRLPLDILQTCLQAYSGPKALYNVGREWGVEQAFKPTEDVDPGVLQFRRLEPGQVWKPTANGIAGKEKRVFTSTPPPEVQRQLRMGHEAVEQEREHKRRQLEQSSGSEVSAAIDIQGDIPSSPHPQDEGLDAIPLEFAMANFVRATIAGVYIHNGGLQAAKQFIYDHLLSRRVEMGSLFRFNQPTRMLSRLCLREGFEPPVARLLAESGRRSKNPVFVVAVYSGTEKLGEGQGSSLNEARTRAAMNALKGWYLYKPMMGGDLPSKTVGEKDMSFNPVFIDVGEVIC